MGSLPLGHKNRSWPSTVCKAPYSGFGTSWLLARPLRDARRGPHCCWHGTKQNGSSERQSPTTGRARTPPSPALCPRPAHSAAPEVPVTPSARVRPRVVPQTARGGSPATPRVSSRRRASITPRRDPIALPTGLSPEGRPFTEGVSEPARGDTPLSPWRRGHEMPGCRSRDRKVEPRVPCSRPFPPLHFRALGAQGEGQVHWPPTRPSSGPTTANAAVSTAPT